MGKCKEHDYQIATGCCVFMLALAVAGACMFSIKETVSVDKTTATVFAAGSVVNCAQEVTVTALNGTCIQQFRLDLLKLTECVPLKQGDPIQVWFEPTAVLSGNCELYLTPPQLVPHMRRLIGLIFVIFGSITVCLSCSYVVFMEVMVGLLLRGMSGRH